MAEICRDVYKYLIYYFEALLCRFLCNKDENFINILKICVIPNLNQHKYSVPTTKLITFVYIIKTNRLVEFRKLVFFFAA